MKSIIIIPARLASTRLPNKPLADICGLPMIVHVWQRACEAKLGKVVVACDSKEIANVIEKEGGRAILTDPDLPSGSDRIYQALHQIDPEKTFDTVINLQGDMPTISSEVICKTVKLIEEHGADITTAAVKITDDQERNDPSVVKVVVGGYEEDIGGQQTSEPSVSPHVSASRRAAEAIINGRALSFSRSYNEGAYHHIGLYVYRREALERFIALPQSKSEKREKLEQLRAMDAGMHIDVAIVDTVPFGVDTPEGLEKARELLAAN